MANKFDLIWFASVGEDIMFSGCPLIRSAALA